MDVSAEAADVVVRESLQATDILRIFMKKVWRNDL